MFLGGLFLLVILSGIGFVYFQTNLLRITHTPILPRDAYQEKVAAFLTSRTPFFFLSAGRIKRELQAEFPAIKELSLTTDVFTNTMNVSYILREAHFLWCKDIPEKECYLVDTQGVIFEKSDVVENTFLASVEDSYFPDVTVGKKIPLLYLEAMRAFEDTFARQNLSILGFAIHAPFSLSAVFAPGVEVRFSLQKNIESQREKLITFLSSHPLSEISALQYIDLRIEDRIYYKWSSYLTKWGQSPKLSLVTASPPPFAQARKGGGERTSKLPSLVNKFLTW